MHKSCLIWTNPLTPSHSPVCCRCCLVCPQSNGTGNGPASHSSKPIYDRLTHTDRCLPFAKWPGRHVRTIVCVHCSNTTFWFYGIEIVFRQAHRWLLIRLQIASSFTRCVGQRRRQLFLPETWECFFQFTVTRSRIHSAEQNTVHVGTSGQSNFVDPVILKCIARNRIQRLYACAQRTLELFVSKQKFVCKFMATGHLFVGSALTLLAHILHSTANESKENIWFSDSFPTLNQLHFAVALRSVSSTDNDMHVDTVFVIDRSFLFERCDAKCTYGVHDPTDGVQLCAYTDTHWRPNHVESTTHID